MNPRKLIVWITLLAITLISTPALAGEGCTVNHVKGTPVVLHEGERLDLQSGDKLVDGDRVVTPTSECQVDWSMNDLAGCRVLPGSTVEVAQSAEEDMTLRVLDGNVVLNLKKIPAGSSFRVETPTAIAAVRGTQFWGRFKPGHPLGGSEEGMTNDVTTFAVRQGAVDITYKDTGETFHLEPGQAIDLKSGGHTTAVREAIEAEMQAMQQADFVSIESVA